MHPFFVALLAVGLVADRPAPTRPARVPAFADDSGAWVTTLGRDTVVLESYRRTASRLEGEIVVRVPGTVHLRYRIDFKGDGSVAGTFLEMDPLGAPELPKRKMTMVVIPDSVRITVDSAGTKRQMTQAAARGAVPQFTTGFGSSFGLYASLAMYELVTTRLASKPNDTTNVSALSVYSGRVAPRMFVRRTPTLIDVDYFRMANVWTHLAVDEAGRIQTVDMRETTEQVKSQRIATPIDIGKAAKTFASRDKSRKGIGVASPDTATRTQLGGATLGLSYGSPRKRDRAILGNVVQYGKVWRTGANAATQFSSDKDLVIGDKPVPAGFYTLWTLPTESGVQLIINKQRGQWGTSYDPAQDFVRIPMKVATASSPRENFDIVIAGKGSTGELRIEWDTFVWTVPVTVK